MHTRNSFRQRSGFAPLLGLVILLLVAIAAAGMIYYFAQKENVNNSNNSIISVHNSSNTNNNRNTNSNQNINTNGNLDNNSTGYRNQCGDGACSVFCDASAVNGVCRTESPLTCPQDCQLSCDWVANNIGPLDATNSTNGTNNEKQCYVGIYNIGGGKTITEMSLSTLDQYSCVTTDNCPIGHWCGLVPVHVTGQSDPVNKRVCVTNPTE